MGRRRGIGTFYDITLVARKEIRQLWRDKATLTFTFIIPVTILLAFGVHCRLDNDGRFPILLLP